MADMRKHEGRERSSVQIRRRLSMLQALCTGAFLVLDAGAFLVLVPWLMESPDAPISLDGNAGAVWLLITVLLALAGSVAIMLVFGGKKAQVGLAPLVNEFHPGAENEPGFVDYASPKLLAAMRELRGAAKRADSGTFGDATRWDAMEVRLRAVLSTLSSATVGYLMAAERVTEAASPDECAAAAPLLPAAEQVLVAAYASLTSLVSDAARRRDGSLSGVEAALPQVEELVEAADAAVSTLEGATSTAA